MAMLLSQLCMPDIAKKTAYSQGQRMLKNVEIQNYIKEVETKLFDENIMSGKEVLYRLTRTARGEHTEVEAVVTKNWRL